MNADQTPTSLKPGLTTLIDNPNSGITSIRTGSPLNPGNLAIGQLGTEGTSIRGRRVQTNSCLERDPWLDGDEFLTSRNTPFPREEEILRPRNGGGRERDTVIVDRDHRWKSDPGIGQLPDGFPHR